MAHFEMRRHDVEARLRFVDDITKNTATFDLFSSSGEGATISTDTERPEWFDRYINAHRIAENNRDYMRKWLTKFSLNGKKHGIINDLFSFAIEYEDPLYLINAYTAATPFCGQLNRDLAKTGSDFRFECDLSSNYQDDQLPLGIGQYLFAAALIHHRSIEPYCHTGITYRGMNLTQQELQQYKPGARILTRSFLSTSKNVNVPSLFLAFNNPNVLPVVAVYQIAQASSSLIVSSMSVFEEEEEVIILPFVAFTVKKVEIDSFEFKSNFATKVYLDEVQPTTSVNLHTANSSLDELGVVTDRNPTFDRETYSQLQKERARKQPCRKSLWYLNEHFSDSLALYIEKCLALHSHIHLINLVKNWDDVTLRLFGEHMERNDNLIKKQRRSLENLSIPLQNISRLVIPDKTLAFEREQAEFRILNNTRNAFDNGALYRLVAEMPFLPTIAERDNMSERELAVDIVDIIREKRWLVILGDPGSGKTTLARWLTMLSAQAFKQNKKQIEDNHKTPCLGPVRLPILVRVGDIAKALSLDPCLSFLDCLCHPTWFGEILCARHEEFIREYILQGHTLIIIDGLDELPSKRQRQYIVSLIRDFIHKHVLSPSSFVSAFDDASLVELSPDDKPVNIGGNQLIVTSRIVGYYAQPLAGDFIAHYLLAPLSNDAARIFIDHWFLNVNYEISRVIFSDVRTDALKNVGFQESWQKISNDLTEKLSISNGLSYLASNPLLLSVVCFLTLERSVEFLPLKRIHLYHAATESMLKVWEARGAYISPEILTYLLADIAVNILQNSPSGLIEEFDLIGNCRTSLKMYRAHVEHSSENTKQNRQIVADFLRMISQDVGLIVPRGLCVYGFLHLTFQEYFVCLYLVRSAANETFPSITHLTVTEVVNRFLRYIADPRFRIPLLLGLNWISWKWATDHYNLFCEQLIYGDNERFSARLPLCSFLLMTAFSELEYLPPSKVICSVLNNFMTASLANDWIIRYEVFLQYLLTSLSSLPVDLVAEWLYMYIISTSSNNVEKIIQILLQLLKNESTTPPWLDRRLCAFLSNQLYTDDMRKEYTIDSVLARISHLNSQLLPSSDGDLYECFLEHHVHVEQIPPALLATIIALHGGLRRFNNEQGLVSVDFSPLSMHRHSSLDSELIRCLTKQQSVESFSEYCRTKIEQLDSDDTSSSAIDLFIAWFCLQGVKQPWIFEPFSSRPAFLIVIARFKRIMCYLHDLYITDDYTRKTDIPSIFKIEATNIIDRYIKSCILTDKANILETQELTPIQDLLPLMESVSISLARLMRKYPCFDLDSPPSSLSESFEADLGVISEKRLLNLEFPEIFQNIDFILKICNVQVSMTTSQSVALADFFHIMCIRSNSGADVELTDDFDPQPAYFSDGIYMMLLYHDNISLLLACLPQHLRALFACLLENSNLNMHGLPLTCMLIETLLNINSLQMNPIAYSLLLTIFQRQFAKHDLASCFVAFLCTIDKREILDYAMKFDELLYSTDHGAKFSALMAYGEAKKDKLNDVLTTERQRVKAARRHDPRQYNQDHRSKFDRDIDLELYVGTISIAVIYKVQYDVLDQNLFSLVDESIENAFSITDPVLRVHALNIIYRFVGYTKDRFGFEFESFRLITREQRELIESEITSSLKQFAIQVSIQEHVFMLMQCFNYNHYDWYFLGSQEFIDQLFQRLGNETNLDHMKCLEAICTAILFIDDRKILSVRPFIYRFMCEYVRSHQLNIKLFDFNSAVYQRIFSVIHSSWNSVLLSSMYLIELGVDVCTLPRWFKQMTDKSEDSRAVKCVSLLKMCHSGLLQEAAVAINRFLVWQAANGVNESEIFHLERALRMVKDYSMTDNCPVHEWLKYNKHPQLYPFAAYAAFFLLRAEQPNLCGLKICFELFYDAPDYFQQQALKCLTYVKITSSHLNMQQLTTLIQLLLDYRLHSSRLFQISTSVQIDIDRAEHVDLIMEWEVERIRLKMALMEIDEKQDQYILQHGLILTNRNLFVSLLQFRFNVSSVDAESHFVYYVNTVLARLPTIDGENVQWSTSDQELVMELLTYIVRHWYLEWYQYHTWHAATTQLLVNSLAILADTCSISSLAKAAVLSLRCCPSGDVIARKHLESLLTKSTHVDNRDKNDELPEQLSLSETRLSVITEATIGSLFSLDLISDENKDHSLLNKYEKYYLSLCYRALLSVAEDISSFPQIRKRLCKLIIQHAKILLKRFIEDFITSISYFTNELCLETHPTYVSVAAEIMSQMPTAFQVAVQESRVSEETFKHALICTSKQINSERQLSCLQMLSMYGDLTVSFAELFLNIASHESYVFDEVFDNIQYIRRVAGRHVVDLLIASLADVSFQRRYTAALLLLQLARNDEVSKIEIQKAFIQVTDEPLSKLDHVYIGEGFGKKSSSIYERSETDEYLDQALFNLLMKLSFAENELSDQSRKLFGFKEMSTDEHVESIENAGKAYGSYVFCTREVKISYD
ncbi:unnamed protein product [Rotaria socialis]|uniref:NACHT domain-containing protein n=1 Tax=Rotaria socialis TaxID=392032 RepID=A0A821SA51_9BILA|nr:unnamed protein product [Rotaria socialis]